MSKTTLKQGQQALNLIAQSEIERDEFQVLLESGDFTALLRKYKGQPAHPAPTITPIKVPLDYGRSLVAMRDAINCDGYVATEINDENYPVEAGESGERELVLVCFHREIDDDEDPDKSELLRELDKLGLKPEDPPELCAVGKHHPDLQREFPVVARRQVWRLPYGNLLCPVLGEGGDERFLLLGGVGLRWDGDVRFLASRK